MANEVRIHTAVTGNAGKELKSLRDGWVAFQKKGMEGVAIGAGMAATTKAFALAGRAIGDVVDWLGEAGSKAAEEERSIAKLTTALRENVAGFNGNVTAIEATIKARTRLGFSDDEQRESLAVLVTRTKDYEKALQLQRLSMDLARLKNKDLASTTDAVGKAYQGNVGALRRFGIAVGAGVDSTTALAEAQKAAEGQAQAYADTSEGAFKSAQLAMEDAQEVAGQKLLPAYVKLAEFQRDTLAPAIVGTVDALGLLADSWSIVDSLTGNLLDFDKAATKGVNNLSDAAREAGGSARVLAKGADTAEDSLDDMKDEAKKATDRLDELKDAAKDALDAMLEAALGPEELKLRLKDAQVALKDNQDELRKLEAIKNPTKEQREDIRDTKLEIIDNKREIIESKTRLVELGKLSLDKLTRDMKNFGFATGDSADEAWDLVDALRHIPGVKAPPRSGGGNNKGGLIHNEKGGFVPPGVSSWVGEGGKAEIIDALPGGGVVVHPGTSGVGPSGGVGTVVVQLVVDGRKLAEVSAPHVTTWQQDRLLLGRP